MGCRLSKNDLDSNSMSDTIAASDQSKTMSRYNAGNKSTGIDAVDYKARLEWKLCVAKDTPEPEFNLSDCQLKDVPSGVFILCRVLRKESLDLSQNKLRSLNGGGSILDLNLLHSLDLRSNRFKKLPDDICKLTNLRELMISNNNLDTLPDTINQLKNLEHLNVADNHLTQITSISCMPNLRILNIRGNIQLIQLPTQLSTCDSLVDIDLDADIMQWPPTNVCQLGTIAILNYLITDGQDFIDSNNDIQIKTVTDCVKENTKTFLFAERNDNSNNKLTVENCKANTEKIHRDKMLEQERLAAEKNVWLEAELHSKQQKRKEEFLQQLLMQQTESDNLVSRIQQEKDVERNKLINDILTAEKDSSELIEKLLILKSEPDPILLEQEHREQEQLLEQLSIKHSDLRKQEILSAMSEMLSNENRAIQYHQDQKEANTKELLLREAETNAMLDTIFQCNDKDRNLVASKIMQNEELQKNAVAQLIATTDARTWALVEQVRIVESQLATLTHYEIERRKLCVTESLNDLSAQRMNLTYLLLDLMEQQTQRRSQLLDTLVGIEMQKQNEQDFWLLQYQKLLDSQPSELCSKSTQLDPLLGYQFLVNGVVHCLPFLSKLWQNKQENISSITDDDLQVAGVKNVRDRHNIFKSIEEYSSQQNGSTAIASAPSADDKEIVATAPEEVLSDNKSIDQPKLEVLAECVVCMEESCKIIFLPCGHLCCCLNCHETLTLCPICRASIERRIKVIQP